MRDRPEASMEDVAKAAGLSRQTVYAHYPSREALLEAVVERASEETFAALAAVDLDSGTPPEALRRFMDIGWQVMERYPFLFRLPPVSPEEDRERHGPIAEWLERLLRRGQATGDFDSALSANWLLAAVFALGNAASAEVSAGRMTVEQATAAVRHGVLRLFGVDEPAP